MFHAKSLKDSRTLRHVGAVISNKDWHLCLWAVCTGSLHCRNLLKADILFFERDALRVKQVADHLSASLKWEVDKLRHSFVAFFV